MALFCAPIRRDSVSLLRFYFRSHFPGFQVLLLLSDFKLYIWCLKSSTKALSIYWLYVFYVPSIGLRVFFFISYSLRLPGILLMCLSILFFTPRAPTITGTVVVLRYHIFFYFYFQIFVFSDFIILFDRWYYYYYYLLL